MERLTDSSKEIPTLIDNAEYYWLQVYFKLKGYEDLEEQGRIVYLPCKVGDTVYRISKCSCWNDYQYSSQTRKKCQGKINIRQCNKRKATCCVYVNKTEFRLKYVAEIGKTVFLTKEEAEQALAEMKKG